MHSVSPYSIRCYNQNSKAKKLEDRYFVLDRIGDKDFFEIVKSFIRSNSKVFRINEAEKQVYCFNDVRVDPKSRSVYGWFDVGIYGYKSDIINIETGKVDFKKAQKNAEIMRHYFHFFIPKGMNEGVCMLHNHRGGGVKTLLQELLGKYFKEKTKNTLQLHPLAYDKAMSAWNEARAKEIRVSKFSGLSDKADRIKFLGHQESELILKPPKKEYFCKLKTLLDNKSDQYKLIEALEEMGDSVKTIVELNGRKRTFRIGNNSSNAVCQIDVDEDIDMDGGIPTRDAMNKWVKGVLVDYAKSLYPGVKVIL